VVYFGERNVDSLGFYKALVPKEIFQKISNGFRRAGIEGLKQEYFAPWSDDGEISTTFSLRDKFVNSIKDYGKVGPNELVWAYSPLMFLFQSIELQRLDTTEIPFYLDLHYFRFEKGNEVCELTKSESFLLWNYLRQGLRVDRPFERRFSLSYVRNYIWASNDLEDSYDIQAEKKVEKISTDGRVYYFEIKGEDPISIDIGFNFFDINEQFMKFKEKKVYDK
jgi:hypothetical protein